MLILHEVSVRFGQKQVLDKCSLKLEKGQRIALLGPSGCGKTTLARAALSLQAPDSGTVECSFRRTAAVFQDPRLLPWATAAENINLVLSDTAESMPRACEWLKKVGLEEASDLCPAELSGGMQQRLSIARALAFEPTFLVMDEPFKAMDDVLRSRILNMTADTLGDTALLLITHSEQEAEALGCLTLHYHNGKFL